MENEQKCEHHCLPNDHNSHLSDGYLGRYSTYSQEHFASMATHDWLGETTDWQNHYLLSENFLSFDPQDASSLLPIAALPSLTLTRSNILSDRCYSAPAVFLHLPFQLQASVGTRANPSKVLPHAQIRTDSIRSTQTGYA